MELKNLQSDFQYDVKKMSCIENISFGEVYEKCYSSSNFRDRTKLMVPSDLALLLRLYKIIQFIHSSTKINFI